MVEIEEHAEEQEGKTCWFFRVPPEILGLIISNLFGADYSNFRATCKLWRSITPPFPPPANSELSKLPYLMSVNYGNCKFFQPLHNTTRHMDIPDLENARIRFSSCGWLLMSQDLLTRFFFNPFTKVKIKLPDLPGESVATFEYFSSPPTSPDCVVIVFKGTGPEMIEFYIIRRGESEWKLCEIKRKQWEVVNGEPKGRHKFMINSNGMVMHGRQLYCVGEAGNIGALDLREHESFTWRILTKPLFKKPRYDCREIYMVKCDGGMLAVFVFGEERRVDVKKLKLPEMIWENVCDLGDQVLYLSYGGSLLVNSTDKWMANKIYFPKFYGNNGVFYSLETKKYHSVDGSCSDGSCFKFTYRQFSTWITAADCELKRLPVLNSCCCWSSEIIQKPATGSQSKAAIKATITDSNTMELESTTDAPLVPWLVITHGQRKKLQTLYKVLLQEVCGAKEIPGLCQTLIRASSPHGWLVVNQVDSGEIFLFNPSSSEKIQLPELEDGYHKTCVVSSPPSDPNCQVFFVSESGDSIMFHSPAKQIGQDHKYYHKQYFDGETIKCPTYCRGEAYCLLVGERPCLASIDFSSLVPELVEEIFEFPRDLSMTSLSSDFNFFLVESSGELLLVHKYYHGLYHCQLLGFSIFRADLVGKTWVKLRYIGQRAIFLDTAQGFSVSTTASDGEDSSETVKGNTIYFFEGFTRCLHVFDMENEEIAILPVSCSNPLHSWVMMSSVIPAIQ